LRRLLALDGLRGVLACLVVLDHVICALCSGPFIILAQIPVAIFFILSGLVLTRAWDGRFATFLARRVVRLWPVYAVTLAAGYALAQRPPEWLEFAWIPYPAYDGAAINAPIWSLIVEVWAALAMPAVVWASREKRRALALGLGFLAVSLALPIMIFGMLFVLGGYLSRGEYRCAVLERALPQWLGRVSYSLYLSHWLVIKVGVMAFGPVGAVAAVPAAFGVAWLVWWTVERPAIAASRRVQVRLPGLQAA